VPDASNEGRVPLSFGPIDRFLLRFEGAEHMVRMIFDYIIVDATSLGRALGARFNVNVAHALLPEIVHYGPKAGFRVKRSVDSRRVGGCLDKTGAFSKCCLVSPGMAARTALMPPKEAKAQGAGRYHRRAPSCEGRFASNFLAGLSSRSPTKTVWRRRPSSDQVK
jgi:hypothetical protein